MPAIIPPVVNGFSQLKKNDGYVLYLSVIILIVVLIYGSIILSSYQQNLGIPRRKLNRLQAKAAAYSGLQLGTTLVENKLSGDDSLTDSSNRFEIGNSSHCIVSIGAKNSWVVVRSQGVSGRDTAVFEGVLGHKLPYTDTFALGVINSGNGLVIADRAVLTGNAAVKNGQIVVRGSGAFSGKKVELPVWQFDDRLYRRQISTICSTFAVAMNNCLTIDSLTKFDTHSIGRNRNEDWYLKGAMCLAGASTDTLDFRDKTIWLIGSVVVKGGIVLKNLNLNISGTITVSDSVVLNNVFLNCIGTVKIEKKSSAQVNIACTDTVLITDDARILYPSVIYAASVPSREASNNPDACILVRSGATVTGTVLIPFGGDKPMFFTAPRAQFEGFLFSNAPVTLHGEVRGVVYAKSTHYTSGNDSYNCWLMDVDVRFRDIKGMVFPYVFFKQQAEPCYLTITEL